MLRRLMVPRRVREQMEATMNLRHSNFEIRHSAFLTGSSKDKCRMSGFMAPIRVPKQVETTHEPCNCQFSIFSISNFRLVASHSIENRHLEIGNPSRFKVPMRVQKLEVRPP